MPNVEELFLKAQHLDEGDLENLLLQLSESEREMLVQLLSADRNASKDRFLEAPTKTASPRENHSHEVGQPPDEAGFHETFSVDDNVDETQGGIRKGDNSEFPIPSKIGDYRVLNLIAVHGQGAVYRADHPHLNRQVVIKVSKNEINEETREVVLAEGRALASVSHENLAQIYDLQFENGVPYIVMEYIEGRNLAEQLKDQPLPSDEAARLVATLAEGIEHAHSLGVIHRDLKPANVVIRAADGIPKIIDFGLARVRNAYSESDLLSSIGGTIAYMAPEQAQHFLTMGKGEDTCDERVDVFALGAILFELLTGQKLYRYENSLGGLELAANGEFEPSLLDLAPPHLRSVCLKALAKDPANRWSSAAELGEALAEKPATKNQNKYLMMLVVPILVMGIAYAISKLPIGNSDKVGAQFASNTRVPDDAIELSFGWVRFTHIKIDYNDVEQNNVTPCELFSDENPLEYDRIRIEAGFNDPRYVFLFALNTDGQIQPCFPAIGQESVSQKEPISELYYPTDLESSFEFSDGVGSQAFFLVASTRPMGRFDEWRSKLGEISWPPDATGGPWVWSNGKLTKYFGPGQLRGAPSKTPGLSEFTGLAKELVASDSSVDVYGLMFQVEKRER